MAKKMLVESVPRQTRIAILEEDRAVELHLERERDQGLVGNIYQGVVHRVLPGMQAAFVDIGLDRDAFLYAGDVLDEVEREVAEEDESEETPLASISDLLRRGQEVVVQIVRDPLPGKGARVTTRITLPGRYLVLLCTSSHHGVSRRIEDEEERERLLGLLEFIAEGVIVRTAGEGEGRAAFEADQIYLVSLWEEIQNRRENAKTPSLLHQERDLAIKVVRDVFDEGFSGLWVEGEETYTRIVEFLDKVQPELVERIRLHSGEEPLFRRFGIEKEIDTALEPKVWLRSGGYLVIHPTEALVAIDVNTGRYVGNHNLEETIFRTNLEAVDEIVRQIRLRNLAGIIVLDLIDMELEEHREEVSEALERELAKDRARTKVLAISEFGLVQITRKRSRPTLERLLTRSCPYCRGRGRVQNRTSICLQLRREVLAMRDEVAGEEVLIRVHPEIARALQGEEKEVLTELEQALGARLTVQADSDLHWERFDLLEI